MQNTFFIKQEMKNAMKIKVKASLLIILQCISTAVTANPITYGEAMQIAKRFFCEKNIKCELCVPAKLPSKNKTKRENKDALYIFNNGINEGFVIVSGDDRVPQILGYAEKGCFDYEQLPENAREWIDGYIEQIHQLALFENVSNTSKQLPHITIKPLLTCEWNQNEPYNNECPSFFSFGQSVTGCVATAFAQVLYYHRHSSPATIQSEIPAYDCERHWSEYGQVHVDAIPLGTPIDWDNLLDRYEKNETTYTKEQGEAVANLMKYCGAALETDYANSWNGGSGSHTSYILSAAKKYFGYSDDASLLERAYLTDQQWETIIFNELGAHRPVIYSGDNGISGHAFVCDGFDGDSFFHINWGWGGSANGYFLLSNLAPNTQGIGGNNGHFNYNQEIIIGLHPGNGEPYEEHTRLTIAELMEPKDTILFRNNENENVGINYKIKIRNYTSSENSFVFGWGIYQNNVLQKVINNIRINDFGRDYSFDYSSWFYIGEDIPIGTYDIKGVSRIQGADTWLPCENSEKWYITAQIEKNSITLKVKRICDDIIEPLQLNQILITDEKRDDALNDMKADFDSLSILLSTLQAEIVIEKEKVDTIKERLRKIEEEAKDISLQLSDGSLTTEQLDFYKECQNSLLSQINLLKDSIAYSDEKITENKVLLLQCTASMTAFYDYLFPKILLVENQEELCKWVTEKQSAITDLTTNLAVISKECEKIHLLTNHTEQKIEVLSMETTQLSVAIYNSEKVVVTSCSYTREYGNPNPNFEFTTEGAKLVGEPIIKCEATVFSPIGSYPIVIESGSVTNNNVSFVAGTLTIIKTPLNIAVGEYTKKQGEEMPSFSLSYNGFKNDETPEILTEQPTISCEATENSAPGEYILKVSGADAENYEISYTDGKLIVTEADPIVVTVKNYTRKYGDDNPAFEYEVSGDSLKGKPEIYCEASSASPVGSYDIVISKGTVENFNVSFVSGTLSIDPAPLMISAGTYTKKQGDPLPEFTLTYSGFMNNEKEDVFITMPVVSCEATETSDPGEYVVKVSDAKAENYDISYTDGKLIVNEADPIIVTAKSYIRKYGDENPTFEYKVSGGTLKGVPEILCEASPSSPVGIYEIFVKEGTVENYNVTYVMGTLTIEKAPLTIAAVDEFRLFDEDNPDFSLTFDGFKNGEDETVLTVMPTAQTIATKKSDAGQYEIAVSGAEATNYVFEYKNGILTIGKAYQKIVWEQDFSEVTVGDTVSLSAYSTSNLPVTFEIVNEEESVLFEKNDIWYLLCKTEGDVQIRAKQEGDKNHFAAEEVVKMVTVLFNRIDNSFSDASETFYGLDGLEVDKSTKGIHIIVTKHADGSRTQRKVLIQ